MYMMHHILVIYAYTKADNADVNVVIPVDGDKIHNVHSLTCHPNHDVGCTFYLLKDAGTNSEVLEASNLQT